MKKFLVTYLIADFDGCGASRLRTGLSKQYGVNMLSLVKSLQLGFIDETRAYTTVFPSAILSITEIKKGDWENESV